MLMEVDVVGGFFQDLVYGVIQDCGCLYLGDLGGDNDICYCQGQDCGLWQFFVFVGDVVYCVWDLDVDKYL